MKIELKRTTHNARLSQETSCFFAEIWIDGAKAGTAENNGRGGANLYRPHSLEATLNAHALTLPAVKILEGEEPYSQNADIVIGDLLDRHLEGKRLARLLRTKTVYERAGKLFALRAGDAPAGARVLNTMAFEDALTLFMKAG